MIVKAVCTRCGSSDVARDKDHEHPGVGICPQCVPTYIDDVCEHGTALNVHCCGCHSGFLFDMETCTCES